MERWIIILLLFVSNITNAQIKNVFKFSTFYIAANGETSLSDKTIYNVQDQLTTGIEETPYDYSLTAGIRKIKRFQYEGNSPFKDGTETTYSDAATIGLAPFEFLFEVDYRRQEGIEYIDQNHFLRYVKPLWMTKVEYMKDGFADIEYYEATQRFRVRGNKKLSFNIGGLTRLAEPYGYDPLEEWKLSNGNLHYTSLALQEGYSVEFDGFGGETYYDPSGNLVAENTQIWEGVVIPQVLADYTEKKRDQLDQKLQHSIVIGFDFYHFTNDFWLHSWGNIMPYHYDDGGEFSFHKFNGGQWIDYSGGLIFGYRFSKSLGVFIEGKYNKYWNRNWHDFNVGVNYVIF